MNLHRERFFFPTHVHSTYLRNYPLLPKISLSSGSRRSYKFCGCKPTFCDKKVVTQASFAVVVFHRGAGGGSRLGNASSLPSTQWFLALFRNFVVVIFALFDVRAKGLSFFFSRLAHFMYLPTYYSPKFQFFFFFVSVKKKTLSLFY